MGKSFNDDVFNNNLNLDSINGLNISKEAIEENKGKTVSRERLMERLWETDCFVDENTLTVNVNRLRKKLKAAGLAEFISTKFSVGYLISE